MITEPGIYPDMPMSEYLSDPCPDPSLSSGTAHALLTDCPAKVAYCNTRLNPDYREPCEDKFDIGTAAHALLLEGLDAAVVVDAADWRTKVARDAKVQARLDGKVPLLPHEYAKVRLMVAAANRYLGDSELNIRNLKDEGRPELSLFWKKSGIWLRSRPDWLANGLDVMLSYKTTRVTANPEQIGRMVDSMGWDIAAALYVDGSEELLFKRPAYVYLIQEVSPPYLCSSVSLTPQYLEMGKQKLDRAIDIWRECLSSGNWPSYPQRIAYVEPKPYVISAWEEKRFDAQLKEQGDDPTENW